MIIEPIEFTRDGRHYRAEIVPVPRVPAPESGDLMWFLTIDGQEEVGPVCRASEDDVPGTELADKLLRGLGKKRPRIASRRPEEGLGQP